MNLLQKLLCIRCLLNFKLWNEKIKILRILKYIQINTNKYYEILIIFLIALFISIIQIQLYYTGNLNVPQTIRIDKTELSIKYTDQHIEIQYNDELHYFVLKMIDQLKQLLQIAKNKTFRKQYFKLSQENLVQCSHQQILDILTDLLTIKRRCQEELQKQQLAKQILQLHDQKVQNSEFQSESKTSIQMTQKEQIKQNIEQSQQINNQLVEQLQQQIDNQNQQIQKLTDKIQQLEQDNKEYQINYEDMKQKHQELYNQIQKMSIQQQPQENQNNEKINDIEQNIQKLIEQQQYYQDTIQQLNQTNQQLTQKLQQVQNNIISIENNQQQINNELGQIKQQQQTTEQIIQQSSNDNIQQKDNQLNIENQQLSEVSIPIDNENDLIQTNQNDQEPDEQIQKINNDSMNQEQQIQEQEQPKHNENKQHKKKKKSTKKDKQQTQQKSNIIVNQVEDEYPIDIESPQQDFKVEKKQIGSSIDFDDFDL